MNQKFIPKGLTKALKPTDSIPPFLHRGRTILEITGTIKVAAIETLFQVSWLLGVEVFLTDATVSHLIEFVGRHVAWKGQLFFERTIE
jgi:hypothetical protein